MNYWFGWSIPVCKDKRYIIYNIIKIKMDVNNSTWLSFIDQLNAKLNKPWLKNKTNFYRLFSVSQRAWLGMIDALNALLVSEEHKWMRLILQSLIDQLTQWMDLADAMESHDYFFGQDEIELVRASQLAWNLTDTLNDIADNLEQSSEISWKLKKALLYPIILLFWSIWAALYIDISVLPNIVNIFTDPNALPWITKVMMKVAERVMANWYYLVGGIIFVIVTFTYLYRKVLPFKIFIDNMTITLPIVAPVVKWNYQYKFAKQLSQFYSAWMNPVVSLQLIWNIFSNYQYKKKVLEIRKDLESWFSIYEWMEWSKLFDAILIQIIHVWESTWTTKSVLAKISSFYKTQLENRIDIMMQALEPVMMVFIAGIIGCVVLAMFLPMAEIVNQI